MEDIQVGLKVHYVQVSGPHLEATVTRVSGNGDVVDLLVVDGDQKYERKTVVYREEPVPYSWHFIEPAGEADAAEDSPKSI